MKASRISQVIAGIFSLWLLSLPLAQAQQLADSISEFTLDNGLRVITVVQDFAPVINFNLMFNVGGVDEPAGLGGIAHMVEHMAFKGTESIGSLDAAAENQALTEVEIAALAFEYARDVDMSAEDLARFEQRFEEARARAQELASPNALDQLISANGGVGLNASTGYDRTDYRVSLPSNRLELYARIYADVLANTVYRSFYEERDVVREERRQRSEDSPEGVLFEAFLRTAFEVHPYGRPLIGDPAEIADYRATEAKAFQEVYYQPSRAVLVLVGDLEVERDIEIIKRYFEFIPRGQDVITSIPDEPAQNVERRVEVMFDAEPQVMVGYRKPTLPARDAYVMDVLDYVLGTGRTSRLFKRMVTDEQLALNVSTSSAFPGIRYPNLFVFQGQPRSPNTTTDLENALYEELELLKTELVSETELDEALEILAASVEVSAIDLFASASFSALSDNIDEVLDIFAGVLMQPEFDPERIEIARGRTLEALRRQNDQPVQIALREFFKRLAEGHPAGYFPSEESVSAISRDDMVAFYQRFYKPNAIVLALSGNFDSEEMLAKLERVFGSWPPAEVDYPELPTFNPRPEPKVYYAEKDLGQSIILIGQPSVLAYSPEYNDLDVANSILGSGGFSSRIFTEIRTKRGLAYSAGSQLRQGFDFPGTLLAFSFSRTEKTAEVIDLLLAEIRRLQDEEVSPEELEIQRNAILNRAVFRFTSPAAVVQRTARAVEILGLAPNYYDSYIERVQEITPADIRSIAQRELRPAEMIIMVVGDASQFDRPLDEFGEVVTIDLE